MKTKSTSVLLSLLALIIVMPLAGCVSAGYQGLVPGKDVHLKNFRQEITTPWGHSTITADELDTTVKSSSTGGAVTLPSVPLTLNSVPASQWTPLSVAK